jgi:hypothetical protein
MPKIGLNFAPPPVSQHACRVHAAEFTRKSITGTPVSKVVVNECGFAGDTTVAPSGVATEIV